MTVGRRAPLEDGFEKGAVELSPAGRALPPPPSRYGRRASPASGSFGHGPKSQQRLLMPVAAKRGQQRRDHRSLVDCSRLRFVEPAPQPAEREPAASLPVVQRGQRGELERLAQVDVADLACRQFRGDEVAALERSAEDGAGVALRGQACSFRGAERVGGYSLAPLGRFCEGKSMGLSSREDPIVSS